MKDIWLNMSKKTDDLQLKKIDSEYEAKMVAFESDCNDGKGEPSACHHVGEFYSVVKDDHAKAAKIYHDNCFTRNYSASCFNLGRLYRECLSSLEFVMRLIVPT